MKPTAKKNFKLTGAYASSVAAYGKPPKGFRFLNIGEKTDPKTDWLWDKIGEGWRKETFRDTVRIRYVPMIRRLPAPVAESAPPKYTGPKISWGDSLADGMKKAGKAPNGWKYVEVGDKIKDTDFYLYADKWVSTKDFGGSMIGVVLDKDCWPVIRRAPLKVAKPAAPKVTMKDLLARIEALEKKLGGKVGLTFGD